MTMSRTQKKYRRPITKIEKGGDGEGGVALSPRSFDLFNSKIYDLKRSVDLRWLFDPVLHSSLDDLVCICIFQDIISAPPISWMTEDQTCDRPICTDSVRANKAQGFHPEGEMHRNVFLTIELINSWHWAKRDTSLQVWNDLLGQDSWLRRPPKTIPPFFKHKMHAGSV